MVSSVSSTSNDQSSLLAEMQARFKSLDTNGDGQVSKEEFLSGTKNQTQGTNGMPPAGGPPPGGAPPGGAPPSGTGSSKSSSSSSSTSSTSSTSDSTTSLASEEEAYTNGTITQTEYEDFLEKIRDNMALQLKYFNSSSQSIQKVVKASEKSDSNTASLNDTFSSFKNDLQQLLQKYGLYNDQGTKTNTSIGTENSVLDITV